MPVSSSLCCSGKPVPPLPNILSLVGGGLERIRGGKVEGGKQKELTKSPFPQVSSVLREENFE